jgi:hypothetical protein
MATIEIHSGQDGSLVTVNAIAQVGHLVVHEGIGDMSGYFVVTPRKHGLKLPGAWKSLTKAKAFAKAANMAIDFSRPKEELRLERQCCLLEPLLADSDVKFIHDKSKCGQRHYYDWERTA